jgi:hypothetical protein
MKNSIRSGNKLFTNFILLILINFPKLNLISFSDVEQGIRLDDILFLLFLVYQIFNRRRLLLLSGINGLLLLLFMFISSILAFFFLKNFSLTTFLFDLRWTQYFLYVYVFKDIFINASNLILKISIWIQLIISSYQVYILHYYRSDGSFNGPWELSIVCLLIAFFIFLNEKRVFYILIALVVIIQSQSRMSLIVMMFLFMIYLFNYNKYFFKNKILVLSGFIISLFFLVPFAGNYIDLSILTKPEELKVFFSSVMEEFKYVVDSKQNTDTEFFLTFQGDLDPSFVMRFDMWFVVIAKYFSYSPFVLALLFGISPGQNGVIIDGLFVRLIFEFGIIGIIFFSKVINNLVKNTPGGFYLAMILVFSGLTLDPFTSSKIMIVFSLVILKAKNIKCI